MATFLMVGRVLTLGLFFTGCSTLVGNLTTSQAQKAACINAGNERIGAEWQSHCVKGQDVTNGRCGIVQCVGVGDAARIAEEYCFDAEGERVDCPTFDAGMRDGQVAPPDGGVDAAPTPDMAPPLEAAPDMASLLDAAPDMALPDAAPPEPAAPTVAQQQWCATEAIALGLPVWTTECIAEVDNACTLARCASNDAAAMAIAQLHCSDADGIQAPCPPVPERPEM